MKITTRFWTSLILSLPMLVEMIIHPFTGWMLPGGEWTMLIFTTIIMVISAGPLFPVPGLRLKNTIQTWTLWLL